MTRISLNNEWWFADEWTDALADMHPGSVGAAEPETAHLQAVRLPHTMRATPAGSFPEQDTQGVAGYLRTLRVPRDWDGATVRLVLDGAAHHATVWCNGQAIGDHACGYTAGVFDLTSALRPGDDNVIAVRLDSRASLDQPPFGGVVDYMTFGGLYRDAWIEVLPALHLGEPHVRADGAGRLEVDVPVVGTVREQLRLRATLRDARGAVLVEHEVDVMIGPGDLDPGRTGAGDLDPGNPAAGSLSTGDHGIARLSTTVANVPLWSPASPTLHELSLTLIAGDEPVHERTAHERTVHERTVRVGFRTVEFDGRGLRINGEPTVLRGLNRHQSWPYLGDAVPARGQRLDAEILHGELGCTVVRTSHYPQSHHFIDRCDELGLLVITEIPGWQHIGGADWKSRAVQNTRDMVRQWRHHPSIIAWGVRINESADDAELYAATNAVAHELDPTRPTTGVRNFAKSELREDVYAFNDFSHTGANGGALRPARVTPDTTRGYLVSEHTGHMFPTKSHDDEAHRLDHALRHARVTSDALHQGAGGVLGWSMFDYQTQRDFGSGDRICHHGVLDMFRNPKLAAATYASQADPAVVGHVLVPSSTMEFGDHAGSARGSVVVFTNADEVRLYRGDAYVGAFAPSADYAGLAHPPVVIDDLIGEQLVRDEGLSPRRSRAITRVLLDVARFGLTALPPSTKATLAWLIASRQLTMAQGAAYFDRYLGSWGGRAVPWRFEAVTDGQTVASVTRAPAQRLVLQALPDTTTLVEGDTWDLASIRLRLVDEHGTPQHYARRSAVLELTGDAALVGPAHVPFVGGSAGTYVRTTGRPGSATLRVRTDGADDVVLHFTIDDHRSGTVAVAEPKEHA